MLEKKGLGRQSLTGPHDEAEAAWTASAPLRADLSLRRVASKRAQAPACAQGPGQSGYLSGFALPWRRPTRFMTGVQCHD